MVIIVMTDTVLVVINCDKIFDGDNNIEMVVITLVAIISEDDDNHCSDGENNGYSKNF